MSDLISRRELLKRFCVNKDGHRIPERDCDNFEITVSIKDIKAIIKEQPTAYDVEKVVEQLEELKELDACDFDNCPVEDIHCFDCTQKRMIERAIKIVKGGGIDAKTDS